MGAMMIGELLVALAIQAASQGEAASERVPLWQTLQEGMTAEEAAIALRGVEGVKTVTVKPSRKGATLSISYTAGGIEVAGLPYRILPDFKASRLTGVRLQSEACLSLATEKYKTLRDLLAQKYGDGRTQREVTEDRQLIAIRDTFSTTPTRVLLRLEPGSIPQHIYGATGFAGALAAIANSSADADVEACPNDRGQKANIEVTYLNNANSAAIDAGAAAEEAAKRERDKNKL